MPSSLPLEIKQSIMTLATRTRSAAANNLTISQEIYPFMEQLVYKKIVLHGQEDAGRFLECLYRRLLPADFAQRHVKALFLVGSIEPSTVIAILSICSCVTSLRLVLTTNGFATNGSSLWCTLDVLPLRSLVLTIRMRFESFLGACHTFTNLSHLELNGNHFLAEPQERLDSIASLTHLCVVLSPHIADPEAVTRLISNPRLQLLAFRVQDRHVDVEEFLEEHGICDDRIVLLPAELPVWGQLGQGDMLIWELAEDLTKSPLPQNQGHRCLSPSTIKNAYAEYLDIAKVPEFNQCAITRRPRRLCIVRHVQGRRVVSHIKFYMS
ncbi:uncharacterized protein HD556DRAFT_1315014 [Suillus plorans]|uniref:Uncharacterized protein n=1 Tax=Suillus plorans TaxID=116603 RepID=A0A9P7D9I6_9AGAM|nr:uncharacterized protein HD556DRAFT_1315014 [Suillus plorans]KAG1784499.1 hypothetical protein HD556DRAFT_1315014 [Suillus plorans]